MSGQSRGLSPDESKQAYEKWKQEFMERVDNDPVAFHAALCLGRTLDDFSRTPVKRYVAVLRERLAENRIHYIKDCDMEPETLDFFGKLVITSVKDTTLTPCQLVGMTVLKKCLPPGEAKFHTFGKVLGVGLHGFVFSCRYKRKQERAVKLVMLHRGWEGNEYEVVVDSTSGQKITSMLDTSFQTEIKLHQYMIGVAEKSSDFRVLNLIGNLSVFKPRRDPVDAPNPYYPQTRGYTHTSRYRRVGVYVMEALPFPTLEEEIQEWMHTHPGTAFPPFIVERVEEVARVIGKLHSHGIAHSDLHSANIAFDPASIRMPYILDFARTQMLDKMPAWAPLYRIMDYALPLYTYLHWLNAPGQIPLAAQLGNAYLRGVTLNERDQAIVNAEPNRYAFLQPFLTEDVQSRYQRLTEVLILKQPYGLDGKRYNFFQVASMTDS